MSSYVILDVGELADLLIEVWSASSRRRDGRRPQSAEDLRREKARLDAEERQVHEEERQLEQRYRDAFAAIEARYPQAEARTQADEVAQLEYRRSELQMMTRTLLTETESLGTAFLANFGNYHAAPALYREVASLKQEIQQAGSEILQDGSLLTEYDAEARFEVLENAVRELERSYDALMGLFAQHAALREEAQQKSERLAGLLGQLAGGMRRAAERVQVLPKTLPGAAAEAQAVRYALDTVHHYLLGPQSQLLSAGQRDEVARLYELTSSGSPLAEIASRSGRDLMSRNEQFRAAKKRSLDRTIYENSCALAEAQERYLTMYETVHGSLEGIRDAAKEAGGSIERQLEILRTEEERLARRYRQILRQQLLEDTLRRALSRSRPGMQVKVLGSTGTGAGNRRMLYQIGADGTAMEVYTDARGQVLIEAGGIVEKTGPATEAQQETMKKNLHYFCSHELPDILESFERELQADDLASSVKLRREPNEDRLHFFTLDAYPQAQDAIILEADGSVRRREAAAKPKRALEEET